MTFDRYTDMHADYTGKGFDQLMDVVDKIKNNPSFQKKKNNPDDWRIILSACNPSDLKKMALPPCHMFAQVSIICLLVLSLVFNYWAILICPTCYPCTIPLYFFSWIRRRAAYLCIKKEKRSKYRNHSPPTPWIREGSRVTALLGLLQVN